MQSCRGTAIIEAALHYTGVNKVSGYTRERKSSENDPLAEGLWRKDIFFVRFQLLPVSGQVQVKNSFLTVLGHWRSHPRWTRKHWGAWKPSWDSLSQCRKALLWAGSQQRAKVDFYFVWTCSSVQSGSMEIAWSVRPRQRVWATSPIWHDLEIGNTSHLQMTVMMLLSYLSAEDVPDFAFDRRDSSFVTHGCCLPTPPPHDNHRMTKLNRENTSTQRACNSLHPRLNTQPKRTSRKGSLSFLQLKWRERLQVWEQQGLQHQI